MNELDEIIRQQQFVKSLKQQSVQIIKLSNNMPSKEEFIFHQKVPQIKEKQKIINKKLQDQILKIKQFVFGSISPDFNINRFSNISEINDQLMENIDICIDKIKKIRNEEENPFKLERDEQIKQIRSKNILKPQDNYNFKDQIDNSIYPFIPKIRIKLNSQMPLDDQIIQVQNIGAVEFFKDTSEFNSYKFPHPYQFEIENLQYDDIQLSIKSQIQKPSQISKQNLFYIDNNDQLLQMIDVLKNEQEIAVDLEHHEYRSFQGITCLIQISCRQNDYIIDPFPIWSQIYQLNIIMTNPKIIKIFHGANMDVQWLQRDFGVYVVNMFDTFQGSKYLKLPQQSYAYLLKLYCNELSDKRMQTADWRIRPLLDEMIQYARIDTHYLINIYDQMKSQIYQAAINNFQKPSQAILSIFARSQDVCLIIYNKPITKSNQYQKIMESYQEKGKKYINILEIIMEWRFEQARQQDESFRYIMNNYLLFQIVDKIIDSQNQDQAMITQILRQYVTQLHYLDENNISILTERIHQVLKNNLKDTVNQLSKNKENDLNQLKYQNQSQVIIFKQQITNLQHDIESSFQLLNLETKLQILKPLTTSIFNYSQKDFLKQDELLNKIKQSFFYSEPTDLLVDMYPMLKEAYEQVLKNEKEDLKQNLQNIDIQYIQEQSQLQEKQIERIDFISVPDMNYTMRKEKQSTQLVLPDISEIIDPQYKQLNHNNSINLKRKRPNKINESPQNMKKNFQDRNIFKIFEQEDNQSDESNSDKIDDEIQKQKSIQQMNKKADLLKSNIEKLQNFTNIRDPIEKMQSKKFMKNKQNFAQSRESQQDFNIDSEKRAKGNQYDLSDQKFDLQNDSKYKKKFKKQSKLF